MFKVKSIEIIPDGGNLKAAVHIEDPDGQMITCAIVKQPGYRAYLDTKGFMFTHKEKRHLQREAVNRWADMIGDTLEGLIESERVFKGSRFNQLGVQLKIFCPVCDRTTPSDFCEDENGKVRNSCYYCGTLRKGKPYIGKTELEFITEKLNARKGTGEDNGTSSCI